MPNPLTDPPAAVSQFVPAAPDWPNLGAAEFAAAAELYDSGVRTEIANFAFGADPAGTGPDSQSTTVFEFPVVGDGLIRYTLSVGAAPTGFEDQFVVIWFTSGNGEHWHKALVQAGQAFMDAFEVHVSGSLAVWLTVSRPTDPTNVAPLSVSLAVMKGAHAVSSPPASGPAAGAFANPSAPGVSRPALLPPS